MRRPSAASAVPSAMPSALPTSPSTSDSASTSRRRWPAVRPEHAEQRELLRPPRDAEREHRIHQEGAGEQRHQRQHREVDAVGARQAVHALRVLDRLDVHHARPAAAANAGRPRGPRPAAASRRCARAGPGGRRSPAPRRCPSPPAAVPPALTVPADPRFAACCSPLCSCSRASAAAVTPNNCRAAGLRNTVAGREHREPVGRAGGGHRHQRRRHRRHQQRIHADDPHRSCARRPGASAMVLISSTGLATATCVVARHPRVQRFRPGCPGRRAVPGRAGRRPSARRWKTR